MQWAAHGRMVCGTGICGPRFDDWLDGAKVDVAITPKAPYSNVPMLSPQSGCITAMPNYDRGEGTPDLRARASRQLQPGRLKRQGLVLRRLCLRVAPTGSVVSASRGPSMRRPPLWRSMTTTPWLPAHDPGSDPSTSAVERLQGAEQLPRPLDWWGSRSYAEGPAGSAHRMSRNESRRSAERSMRCDRGRPRARSERVCVSRSTHTAGRDIGRPWCRRSSGIRTR